MSRTTVSRPLGRFTEDTPEARREHQLRLADWLGRHPSGSALLNDPPPLEPGTLEQTADLCIKCARGNHTALLCTSPETVSEVERNYRSRLLYRLKKAPTPARSFDQYLVDIKVDEDELEAEAYAYEQGNK
ncbi:hypothetical protein BN14_10331 [Rhizoctonia solani AG-1 IB]|uniref:Uncharacterized protein n=1 Tax=Thanatephorus cucumeris (strain AG1-IB / isolate 7/3/14) TaxID=1108050 RepID=M5C8A9_THACB|nr:hypothetical protein BN14_10331 [Rhizoctonia solani AG-1 IB]